MASAIANLQQFGSLKDVPLFRQLGLLLGLAVAIAGGAAMFTWSQRPAFVSVFPGLDEKDSGEVAEALRAANLPFRIDPGSGAVTVPGDKVYEVRMKLASQGLPHGGAMGFEMIQQDQSLGTSQFIETARYQLALETELGRTVSSLQPVKSARVHLALPKPSPFVRKEDNASGSVLVELYPGRQLQSDQVASIVHLVAASVPSLAPGSVTVIDQYGHLLTSGDADSTLARSGEQYEQTRRLEADYVRRIEDLLSPMLGPGRVSAQVTADMDFSITEEAQESYKPGPAAIRSEQTSQDITRNGSSAAQGVPGAISNQPPPAAAATNPASAASSGRKAAAAMVAGTVAAASGEQPSSQSTSSTRNYELDRTVSHTTNPVGRLRKLSVAVLVDNVPRVDAKGGKPTLSELSPEEMKKVDALVREAVGFDAARGDSVSVQNAPFAAAEQADLPAPPLWKRPETRELARQSLGAVTVLVLIFAVLRPLLKTFTSPARPTRVALPEAAGTPAMALALAGTGGASLAQTQALAGPAPPQGQSPASKEFELKIASARSAVAQDPKRVAQVVKTWIGEDG